MAGFTLGELKRRRERLEERLDYLRKRVDEEGGQIPGRHCYKSAEASALQTALVLFDEEIERAESGTGSGSRTRPNSPRRLRW